MPAIHSITVPKWGLSMEKGRLTAWHRQVGDDLGNWLFNQQALAEKHVVYALDLPGHGESSKDVGAGTLDELAAVAAAFLETVGVQSAHLVGHSLGGAVALAMASSAPERVRSLSLICSAGLGREINAGYIEGFV